MKESKVSVKYRQLQSYVARLSTIFNDLLQNHFANQSQISWEKRAKVCINGLGHMFKMAATPIMVKPLKILFHNLKSDDLETWHGALVSRSAHSI